MALEDRTYVKIKKLLALANDAAASEGERDNALRMAYSLLAKHNLTVAQLEAENGQAEEREMQRHEFYGRPWALHVAHATAQMFFCEYFYRQSSNRNMVFHYFIGKESNVVSAMEMAKYLISSILREGSRRMREKGEGAAWRRSFCLGATDKLRRRMRELMKQEEKTTESTGTSIVLASLYRTEEEANKKWMENQGISLKSGRRGKSRVDGQAWIEGEAYGSALQFNKGIGQ